MIQRCPKYTLGGSRCQHMAGHAGKHSLDGVFRVYAGYSCSYSWTDESEMAQANRLDATYGT